METDKLRNAVGLCMRAGKCATGDLAVGKRIAEGKIRLVILDGSASANMTKKYMDASAHHGFRLIRMSGLGEAIGRPERKVMAVSDANFVKLIEGAAAPKES